MAMQEFLTISQLAHGFSVSEKVIRHAFKKLLKEGKLADGDDFIREGYRDDLHFIYKIHPGKFAAHTHLFPAPSSVEPLGTHVEDGATTLGNQDAELDSKPKKFDSQDVNGGSSRATTDTIVDTKSETEPSVAGVQANTRRDYLDEFIEVKDEEIIILKDHLMELRQQLAKKDEQIAHKDRLLEAAREDQNDARQLIRVFGERVVEMSKLQLPGGVHGSQSGSQLRDRGSNRATQHDELGSQVGNKERATENMSATPSAGQGSTPYAEHENFVDTGIP